MSARPEKLTGGTNGVTLEGAGCPQETREGPEGCNDTLTEKTVATEPPRPSRDYADITYPEEQYIALLECDFECGWNKSDLPKVIEMWHAGVPGADIARQMRRDPDELAVLIMSLKREGRIRERPGAWEGKKKRKGAAEC